MKALIELREEFVKIASSGDYFGAMPIWYIIIQKVNDKISEVACESLKEAGY
jgi:hypothetical protein